MSSQTFSSRKRAATPSGEPPRRLANREGQAHSKPMKNRGELAPAQSLNWTRVEDYLGALARRRTERRRRGPKVRTQPEAPRLLLSTLPFLVLLAAMAVL